MFKRLQILRKPQRYFKWPRGHRLRWCAADYSELWTNTWLWEVLSVVVSGICIILVFVILKIYDQKPVPQFTYGITLNAIISTLTTFSKSPLLVAVAGAISQLKWRWFHHTEGRRVIDTQLFDDASRGPWGSLIFLTRPSRWSLASVGALVSILALAFEPFTQQLTTYPARKTVVSTPGAGPSNIYRAKSYLEGDVHGAAVNILDRLTATLWDPLNEAERFATVQCPTGNCTWEEFESLAFCTSCNNKTSGIELTDATLSWNRSVVEQVQNTTTRNINDWTISKTFSLHLPTGFPSRFTDGHQPDLTITAQFWIHHSILYITGIVYPRHLFGATDTVWDFFIDEGRIRSIEVDPPLNSADFLEWRSRRLPLLRFCHVELKSEGHEGPKRISPRQATLCDLTPCVKRYSFSILNGIPILDTLGERYGSWYFNATDPFPADPVRASWADIPGKNGLVLNENTTYPSFNLSSINFSLSSKDIFELSNTIKTQFNGQLSVFDQLADNKANRISNNTALQLDNSFLTGSPVTDIGTGSWTLWHIDNKGGLVWAMPRIAAAIGRYLRDEGAIQVQGRAYTFITIVEVRWQWLVLPVTTWLCGAVFLMLTMWVCRGGDGLLWKTSSLPLIYHGFEDQDVEYIEATGDKLEYVSGMEKYSQNLYARIRRNSMDGRLKLMRTLPPM